MSAPLKVSVIIPAAGSSSRMNMCKKKELLSCGKGTVLSHSVLPFFKAAVSFGFEVSQIVIVSPLQKQNELRDALGSLSDLKEYDKIFFCDGGSTRQESVYNALKFLSNNPPQFVLIHDGARPFVSEKLICSVIDGVRLHFACIPGLSVTDTVIQVDKEGKCVAYPDRETLRAVQTPQGFVYSSLWEAHQKARVDALLYTDDSKIWEKYAGSVFLCEGDVNNKKITYETDLVSLEKIND